MIRLGVDFGGTKIEAAAIDRGGDFVSRRRVQTPQTYKQALDAVVGLVEQVEGEVGMAECVGIGVPGTLDPRTGIMRNANATFLNGKQFQRDLENAIGRPVRLDNDANCLALSEVCNGAATGARTVFAIIIGTGCGGGLVVDGRIVQGANRMTSEWGHVPLPWVRDSELPQPQCWCGLSGCLERWISGSGFRENFERRTGEPLSGHEIIERARAGNQTARDAFADYLDQLARGMAMLVNIIDPDCFVLGGGMSNNPEIYEHVPNIIPNYTFGKVEPVQVVQAQWGDSSGVRGAAFL